MPIVHLVRHGQNDFVKRGLLAGRLPGVHLNDKGRAEAEALAAVLKAAPLKAVYSSPLERAVETAQFLARLHGLKVEKRPGLLETALGDWEGKSLKRLTRDKRWRQLQEHPSKFRYPGGEWIVEQQARLVIEMQTLCARHKARDQFAVVSHGDPLKLIIAYYIGLPLDSFQGLGMDTASLSTLALGDNGNRLLRMNWKPM